MHYLKAIGIFFLTLGIALGYLTIVLAGIASCLIAEKITIGEFLK